jgi:predicted lipid carrier protein YhbT
MAHLLEGLAEFIQKRWSFHVERVQFKDLIAQWVFTVENDSISGRK